MTETTDQIRPEVSTRPIAIVIGAIGKLPYAGMTYYWLHHIVGLQELGFHVHYIESQSREWEYYDSSTDRMTNDVAAAVRYLASLGSMFGAAPDRFTLLDATGAIHGSSRSVLLHDLEASEILLDVADATWFPELHRCRNRVFIDGDPMYTQVAMLAGDGLLRAIVDRYETLYSYGTRIGQPDCAIPDCGRSWLPFRPVVATSLWPTQPEEPDSPLTALLHWSAGGALEVQGVRYGNKDVSFAHFMDLPSRISRPATLALGGGDAPRTELVRHGWRLVNPLEATADAAAYQRFIRHSRADLGIAKHAYTASRSGWFSDRSICFLASGRPVLHQDTGFADWLPAAPGVLRFADLDELAETIDVLERDYSTHSVGARLLAEHQFESRTVLRGLLEASGVAVRVTPSTRTGGHAS